MKKHDISNDDLAQMVQKGFLEVHEKMQTGFHKVSSRFDALENRLDAIEIELIDIKKKLDNVIYRHEFENLRDQVKHLEARLTLALKKK